MQFNVGGLFINDFFILNLSKKTNNIKSVFGSPSCLFQGGRLTSTKIKDLETIEWYLKKYNEYGISCRFTFSSNLIKEEELEDEYCNNLLYLLNKYSLKENPNGVICSLDILNDYVHNHYPNLITISSLVKPAIETGFGNNKDTAEYYNSLLDKYDIVVVNTAKAKDKNLDFFEKITDIKRIEIIINNDCIYNCYQADVHYNQMAIVDRKRLLDEPYETDWNNLHKTVQQCLKNKQCCKNTVLNIEEVKWLIDIGIENLKIQGREFSEKQLKDILNTYIKE